MNPDIMLAARPAMALYLSMLRRFVAGDDVSIDDLNRALFHVREEALRASATRFPLARLLPADAAPDSRAWAKLT